MSHITMSEKLSTGKIICFDMTMEYKLTFFGMKFARHEFEAEAEECSPETIKDKLALKDPSLIFTYQKQAAVLYLL